MKKFLALLALLIGFAAHAASVTVTIPSITLAGDVTAIAGSFDYDTTTSAVSNVNITATGGTRSGTYTVLGGNVVPGSWFYVRLTGASGTEVGNNEILIQYSSGGIPAGGGSGSLNRIDIATCTSGAGACVLLSTYANFASSVPVAVSAPPAAVPTLSEWAMITFAMLIVGFGVYQQRRRQL